MTDPEPYLLMALPVLLIYFMYWMSGFESAVIVGLALAVGGIFSDD